MVAGLLIAVVLSLYLLLDGRKVVAWLLAYVPRAHRRRMGNMAPEVFEVVQAFTTGQMITSALFSVFTFVVLTILRVPGAVPLALFAGLCDAIPVAGILVATAAASLCALMVSPSVALIVLGIYLGYHLFEAYVLVPRLYGNRMRLSTLTVLLAILAGGTLGGVIGAVLALPVVAAYPVFEKHWLDDYLHPDAGGRPPGPARHRRQGDRRRRGRGPAGGVAGKMRRVRSPGGLEHARSEPKTFSFRHRHAPSPNSIDGGEVGE